MVSSSQSQAIEGRPFDVNDIFSLQQLGRYYGGPSDFSPDGRKLAFVIERPKREARHFTSWLAGNDRADIYVTATSGSEPTNITNGKADDSGFWSPSWSPDSRRLAMLSTRGGNVHLWVWDSLSGSLLEVIDSGVDIYTVEDRPYVWISATRLLVQTLPRGVKPDALLGNTRASVRANTEWPKTWSGEEVAVSVLKSGVKPDLNKRQQGALLVVDVATKKSQLVASGTIRNFIVSPDRQAIAFLRRVEVYQPQPNKAWEFDYRLNEGRFELDVISTDGAQLLERNPLTYDVIPRSLRWSFDSQEMAFLTYTKEKKDAPQMAWFRRPIRTFKVAQTDEITPLQLNWTKRGWIVFGVPRGESSGKSARLDWWLIGESGKLRCLTESLPIVPSYLVWDHDDSSYLGLSDGHLWRISVDAPPLNLTARFEKRITGIAWPQQERQGDVPTTSRARNLFVVSVDIGDRRGLFSADLSSGQLTELPMPTPNASIIGFSPNTFATLYHSNDRTGLHLWLAHERSAQPSLIYEANTFLREIAVSTHKKINYRSLDGQALSAWVLLPPNYHQDKRYPVIVWAYPGSMAGPSPSSSDDITNANALNLQIPAARGYVVLRPSMPLNPMGVADDPMLKLPSGVLPAVEKLVELGIADPDRVFLMGQSFGAYATYGLVTQTKRFKAAVAMSWAGDLISFYNQLNSIERYDDYPHEATDLPAPGIEYALRLGGKPPWDDFEHYQRNNPIFYVNRVETPLLIIHGDMDAGFTQAEEFFMALYRQGKRAEFARYWGEGHVFESPPNIRDMWERIFAWFAEFSPRPSPPGSPSQPSANPH